MKRLTALTLCLLLCLSAVALPSRAYSIDFGHFNGLEEYEQFLKKVSMPSSYIHASRFAVLGDFTFGTMLSSSRNSYRYCYTSGYSVEINHQRRGLSFATKQLKILPPDTVSMKHTTPPEKADSYYYYFRNGLYYIYSRNGDLYSLEWFADGIHFSVDIYDGRNRRIPAIDDLMTVSDDEFNAAFDRLCSSAGLSPHREHFAERNDMNGHNDLAGVIFVTIIIAACAAAVGIYLVKKRRRAEAIRIACSRSTGTESS